MKRASEMDKPHVRARAFDALIAAGLLAISLMVLVPMDDLGNPLGVGLLGVHSGCLVWRRRAPVMTLGVNLVSGALVVVVLDWPVVTLGVAVLVVLYTVALHRERNVSLPAAALTIAVMVGALVVADEGDASTLLGNALVLGVIWFLGDTQRARRDYVARLEERTVELERARHELAQSAVAEERLRIARELHDVVAHSMGMIAVQAGVGAHVIDSRPDEARRSLETIERASKSALTEIRQMLGLLRSSEDRAETEPPPGLADLPKLAEEVGRAGVQVDLRVDEAETVPEGLQLTIYRIVQEALTNTIKHAKAPRATVSVRVVDGVARVDVVDAGVGAVRAPSSGGHGIAGMRERATMHGGTLEAAPLPAGGFRVSAELPVTEQVG